jgi:hypothetical protein
MHSWNNEVEEEKRYDQEEPVPGAEAGEKLNHLRSLGR